MRPWSKLPSYQNFYMIILLNRFCEKQQQQQQQSLFVLILLAKMQFLIKKKSGNSVTFSRCVNRVNSQTEH